jgi:1-acyl-sn-glycerol-3-phosphate acyltransferase
MPSSSYSITYPRRKYVRAIARTLGRLLLPLLFHVRIEGWRNFPEKGPLIVVGNHTAVMEAVLMAVFTPWQVELLGAGDLPQEKITEWVEGIYGYIPVNRGHFDRDALTKALDVLVQRGILGIFPEGGIWEPGLKRAQTGVAWLSYRRQAPVLPVYFGGTLGAIGSALRLQRPQLTMIVGKVIPPAQIETGQARKFVYEKYANRVLQEIENLRPEDEAPPGFQIENENFELYVLVEDREGNSQIWPEALDISHPYALAKLLHRPGILKIFHSNLNLPVAPLEDLENHRDPRTIARAVQSILSYLEEKNPYLLSYRFGQEQADAMWSGLDELNKLARWAKKHAYLIHITPIRKYNVIGEDREITQTKQGGFQGWM